MTEFFSGKSGNPDRSSGCVKIWFNAPPNIHRTQVQIQELTTEAEVQRIWFGEYNTGQGPVSGLGATSAKIQEKTGNKVHTPSRPQFNLR